jgi:hypothetical protein
MLKTIFGFISKKPLLTLAVVVVTALAARTGVLTYQLNKVNQEADSLSVVILNNLARADTLEQVNLELGDSLLTFEQLAVQDSVRDDSVAAALNVSVKARVAAEAQIAALKKTLSTAPTTDSADVRSADFAFEQPPYTISGTATLPKPPAPGRVRLGITLAPASLQVRLTCSETEGRTNQAQVILRGPTWLRFSLSEVVQSMDICNPTLVPVVRSGSPWWRDTLLGGVVGATLALVFEEDPLKGVALGGAAGFGLSVAW